MEAILILGDDIVLMMSVVRRRRQNGLAVENQCQQCAALTPDAILVVPSGRKRKIYLSVYVPVLLSVTFAVRSNPLVPGVQYPDSVVPGS
jgi:hypothetical protein